MVGQVVDGPSGPDTIRLDTPLGGGAFGIVFTATDTTSNKLVAVKFPQIGMLGNQAELVAFANEVQAAHEIKHPNVVRVLFTKSDPNTSDPPYLVMEYIQGGTLKQYLDALKTQSALLSNHELQEWMNQLLDGIEAINTRMLHRDLKPDNILIDGGTPKIADFGLSKIVGAATRTRTFKGGQHVLYMAPEGWKLEPNAIQLDMYSMGIVFFEMATLNFPYEIPANSPGFDFEAFKEMHMFQPPKRLKDFRQDVPSGVDQIIQLMLAKRAEDRFKSWEEIRQALVNAWGTAIGPRESASESLTDQLLEEIGQSHKQRVAEQGERERLAQKQEDETKIFIWQIDQLLDSIRSSVEALNEQSALGSIQIREVHGPGAWKTFAFDVPFAGVVLLRFHRLDPPAPVELKRGLVSLYAHLADKEGAGFNYILVRKDACDIYGEWLICKICISAIVDPVKVPPRLEPFGFESPDEFRREMRYAERCMHIYKYQFEPTDPDYFLEIVREAIRRKRENGNK